VLRLTDTQTKTVREVVPSTPGLLRVYACGPTVYRDAHVGNLRLVPARRPHPPGGRGARAAGAARAEHHRRRPPRRRLGRRLHGEDKLLAQARLEDKSPFVIARFYEDAFHRDMALLNNRPADAYPRASEWIGAMLELIGRLVELGTRTSARTAPSTSTRAPTTGTASCPATGLEDLRAGHRLEAADVGRASGSTPTGRCGSGPAPPAR
jgi:cysteinyl-tRNA synthetase